MTQIRVAIVGVGNCTSSLVQGIHYYREVFANGEDVVGLAHPTLGGLAPGDIEIVAAIDVDARKVGTPLHEAIFARPNNTKLIYDDFTSDVTVTMGNPLDGVSPHMGEFPDHQAFRLAKDSPASKNDICRLLRDSGAEILMNYLPVGSQHATEFYAECCLEAGVSLINCIPVFIVSNPNWAKRFTAAGIPCVGDDIKAQVGATITHRVLTRMMHERGAKIDHTYQLNWAGNTDFLNMLERSRLKCKKISKTNAVQSQLDVPLPADDVHIGPAEFVPWQKDNKVCALRIEARGFGGVPLHIEARLSVEDSPNSAGETIDAIRVCKLARDRGLAGPLEAISAYTMKHPPRQFTDYQARDMLEAFIGEPATEELGRYEPEQATREVHAK
ncbi:MAG: inositol-3-phosphate synthase [Planctomycetes bacterium]|jgi:myo-inositol-1-phosphate synthase|nr:inositol-3-phosphate synthase [Planctomycetota bacterium]